MNALSLRQRLTALVGGLAFLLLLLAWILVTVVSHRYSYRYHQSVLEAVRRELLEEMEPWQTADGDFPEMIEEIHEAIRMTSERFVILHLRDGVVAGRSHPDQPRWPQDRDSADWMAVVLPFHGEQLVVALYYGDTRARLLRQAALLAIVGLGCLAGIIAGTWILVGRVLSPIGALSRQARTAETELQARLTPPSRDAEIVQLVDTLNQFLDGFARTSQARSRFYSAASHELRTPLQALSGHLELALNKERSASEYREALSEARRQSTRLTRLTQDLLLLNRLETSASHEQQIVDLGDYCENAWNAVVTEAKEKNLRTSLELPEGCSLRASPSYLAVLCRNLLQNAVKYATRGGALEVEVRQGTMRIYNDCQPIAQEDFQKLCEPFFRPDASRTSSTGGNGLGLSLVKAIVDHEGWQMSMEQTRAGFEVVITAGP